ncbi:PP2C family protein-serine/threonine phosphatase [Sneathiella chinensis]|uniref:Fused response regulator/phosphatase n=1 Tax=Sneathiella chinensis TaxID=349750 RepID=A0ABQ5U6R1_9PROT|nr:fused response regulator/phosphatase [Sneathiella chinensis]GLQ06954.1 fused response regulator/phosphatase [Sneathiella chinensis]
MRFPDPRPSPTLLSSRTGMDISHARILIVDDSPLIRELIGACLQTEGYRNIGYAENGQDALDVIEETEPDLIILDLEMPVMDGFTLCQKLRSKDATRDIPILVESGLDSATDITRAFEYGASDMIAKPIKKYEITARTRVHLEHHFFVRALTDYHNRVASELEQARHLQFDLCPSDDDLALLEHRYGVRIRSRYEPSSELGGDIWGVLPVSDSQLAFYIADFSGHGVAAALNTFRLQTCLATLSGHYDRPAVLLNRLNTFLYRILKSGSYATMLFACLDLEAGLIRFAGAGSQPPLHMGNQPPASLQFCNSHGMPLGLRPDWEYQEYTVPFDPDMQFMLYSDALIEVEDSTGAHLGESGLCLDMQDILAGPERADPVKALAGRFASRLGSQAPDDLTIFLIARTGRDA